MSYVPKETTRRNLDDLHHDLGSNARVAEFLNKRSRGRSISAAQVRRMRAGQAVRLTQAQKRRLQRNTSSTTVSPRREEVAKTARRKRATLENISAKKERLKRERNRLLIIGRVSDAQAIDDELARLDDFRDDIQEAARNVDTYDDYRNIADKTTP
jgi:microsomal dipeptidase-like Zn-dependent dipeptidase